MIILRICGLLAILVSIVPANPIMGDVDTTVSPLQYDMSTIPSAQELTTIIESGTFDPKTTVKETDSKMTLAPLTSNEENTIAPSLDTKNEMQNDMPNGDTPVVAEMTVPIEKPTTTSMAMDSIVETTTSSLTLPPTTPSTTPTTVATQPPTAQPTESPTSAPTTVTAVTATAPTMATTNSNEHANDILKESDVTVPVVQDEKTMTPPVTEIKSNDIPELTKSPISETSPVGNDDDINNLAALVTIPHQVDANTIIQPHPAINGASPGEIAGNLASIFTVPGPVDENSLIQPHDEVDNVLTLSSNEDTTRIASSTDSKVDSDKNNHIVPLSAENEPPKSAETKNEENGNSFASSISLSFTVLVSMTVLYVIM